MVDVEFLLAAGGEGIYKRLAFVVVGQGSEYFFPGLFDGRVLAVFYEVPRADELHQRTNVRFFRRVNGGICLSNRCVAQGRALRDSFDGILRCSLNHQEKSSNVNNDQCKDRLHDCLRGGFARVCATTPILGTAVERRDGFAGQSCRVVHWPNVQAREQVMNFCYDAWPCAKRKCPPARLWELLIPRQLLSARRASIKTSPRDRWP